MMYYFEIIIFDASIFLQIMNTNHLNLFYKAKKIDDYYSHYFNILNQIYTKI